MRIGNHVQFYDEHGVQHQALLTSVFDNSKPEEYPHPSVNLVCVSMDESQSDQYGRQIFRKTSVPHKSNQSAHGYFWE